MDDMVSNVTRGLSTEDLGSVRAQAQLTLLRRAQTEQAQQVQQLVESVPTPTQPSPGQPGAIINTHA